MNNPIRYYNSRFIYRVGLTMENLKNICIECGGKLMKTEFETTCSQCGLVENDIDLRSTYFKENNEGINQKGSKQYVHIGNDVGVLCNMATFIDYKTTKRLRDFRGNPISTENQTKFKRLIHFYQKNSAIKKRESEYRIMKQIKEIGRHMDLSNIIIEYASTLFLKILRNEKQIKNRVVIGAACIFKAIRTEKFSVPVSIKEIAEIYTEFGHYMTERLIIRTSLKYQKYLRNTTAPKKSEDYLTRLVNLLTNSDTIKEKLRECDYEKNEYEQMILRKSYELLKNLKFDARGGRNPLILGGAIIYCADKLIAQECNTRPVLTQKIASEAMNIAEYSIRDHFVKILKPNFC
jgi:transcription initiation factor TFIIIB Brf1 subunit/transcription initiation factor TFIIB